MQNKYLIPGIVTTFLLLAVIWFVQQPAGSERATVRGPSTGSVPVQRVQALPLGENPFLPTHEQRAAFVPDAENLAPTFHAEMETLKQRLAEAPKDTAALLRMARLKQDGHSTEEAVVYYQRYLDLHPETRSVWLDLAQNLGALKRWEEALVATEEMLMHFPDDPGGLYNLGAIHANKNRMKEAREVWERAAGQDADARIRSMAEHALRRIGAGHP